MSVAAAAAEISSLFHPFFAGGPPDYTPVANFFGGFREKDLTRKPRCVNTL
jgi:hypothetical protein